MEKIANLCYDLNNPFSELCAKRSKNKMQADETTLKKIEELSKRYKETWGKKVDYTIIPIGITQEKFVKCLELMIEDNLSLVVAYTKLFKK